MAIINVMLTRAVKNHEAYNIYITNRRFLIQKRAQAPSDALNLRLNSGQRRHRNKGTSLSSEAIIMKKAAEFTAPNRAIAVIRITIDMSLFYLVATDRLVQNDEI